MLKEKQIISEDIIECYFQLVGPENQRLNFIHSNLYCFFVFSLFKIWNLRNLLSRTWKRSSENYLPCAEQYFNQWNKCKFSHHVFSTNHKGKEVHNPETVNYFNSLYRLPRKTVMIPKEVITALNKSVATTNSPPRTPKRGKYTKYIDSDRATIGRYAGENGTQNGVVFLFSR